MLAINEEFVSYQGEGMQAGVKMYFVRLQGCSVGCHFCDTKYTWKSKTPEVKEEDIVKRAKESGCEWVCLTGGEPLEQDIRLLLICLKAANLKIQVETSGMFTSKELRKIDWVTVSPKNLFAVKGIEFLRSIMSYCDELKCVITKEEDVDFYIKYFKDIAFDVPYKIFQPVDNSPQIADMLLKRDDIGEWRVRCQEQKILELR